MARIAEGFRRLSLLVGTVSSLAVFVLVVYLMLDEFGPKSAPLSVAEVAVLGGVLVVIMALAFVASWGFTRLIGWVLMGFLPHRSHTDVVGPRGNDRQNLYKIPGGQ